MPSQPPSSGQPTVVVAVVDLASVVPPALTAPEGPLELSMRSMFDHDKERFRFETLLGSGGTSRVYAAFDGDLEREVAIKVVPVSGMATEQMFAREARVTSSLAHPNVPPVYDVGVMAQGYYLTLPRIRGRSLRALIAEAIESRANSALPVQELVEVFLKICDALAYAHDQGVVHQDIKPGNIMIGSYGEVMLVDWGAASVVGEEHDLRPVMGTPAYIAPEQAYGSAESPLFDVYALGATLFHALLLRKPLVDSDVGRFWKRKASGDLDHATREELSRLPRALLAIVRRAMAANPEERYPTISEFAHALRDFSAGGKNWSAPILHETFADPSWRERWQPVEQNSFELTNEGLVSKAPHGALLYYTERLSGGLALEFDAAMLATGLAGDISAIWTEDDAVQPGSAHFPKPGSRTFCFQVGALSNHLVGIFKDFHSSLSSRSLRLELGKVYRIRVEIDERMLRLSLDGELVAEYEERIPLRSGYVALYAYYPDKSFANVRIYQRGQPEHISPLAIGDAFFARGDYDEAEREYRRVELGQGSAPLVTEAVYKHGLCELKRGRTEEAFALWKRLDGPEWGPRIELHAAENHFERREHGQTLDILGKIYREQPSYRGRVIQRWSECMTVLVGSDDAPLLSYLTFRSTHFAEDPSTRSLAARALLGLGRFEEVVERFLAERLELCDALLALGRFDTILAEHGDMTGLCDATLVRQGKFDHIVGGLRSQPRVLLALGRYEEAAALAEHAEVLVAAGHYERALAAGDCSALDRVTALVRLGRLPEAILSGHPLALIQAGRARDALEMATTLEFRIRILHALALEAFARGDREAFVDYRAQAEARAFSLAWEDFWCERFVLLPLAAELLGDVGALERALEPVASNLRYYWSQRAYFVALAILGRIDDGDFVAQPASGGAPARLQLAHAVRADARGAHELALSAYKNLAAMPVQASAIDSVYVNPTLSHFISLRTAALQPYCVDSAT